MEEYFDRYGVLKKIKQDLLSNSIYNIVNKDSFTIYQQYFYHCIENNLNKNAFLDRFQCINTIFDFLTKHHINKSMFYDNLFQFIYFNNEEESCFNLAHSKDFRIIQRHINFALDAALYTKIHELNHLISCKLGNIVVRRKENQEIREFEYFTGLSKSKITISDNDVCEESFGLGLTEGMTEYITSLMLYSGKLFEIYPDGSYAALYYMSCVQYIKALVSIVGLEKMLNYYYSADVDGLFEELSSFKERKEVILFIETLDQIKNIDAGIINEKEIANQSINYCNEFLRSLSINKYGIVVCEEHLIHDLVYDDGRLEPSQFDDEFDVFFNEIGKEESEKLFDAIEKNTKRKQEKIKKKNY